MSFPRVLAQYDTPAPTVRLRFQIIAANGAATTDSAIADIESVLRRLFRFRGYRLLAEAMLGGVEGSAVSQTLASEGRGGYPYFQIHAGIGSVRTAGAA